jgi:hypothetical protein
MYSMQIHLISDASVQIWSKQHPPRNVLSETHALYVVFVRRRRPHPKNTACWQSVMKANTNLFYDASLVLVINVSACSEVRYLTLGRALSLLCATRLARSVHISLCALCALSPAYRRVRRRRRLLAGGARGLLAL